MSRSCHFKIAMVDRHALFTECLGLVLEVRNHQYRTVPVPCGPGHCARVVTQLLAARPDVLLLSADLGPGCDALMITEPLARAGVAVVVLTDAVDEHVWGQHLARGARCAVSKTEPLVTMVSTVRRLASGEPVLDRLERERLIRLCRQQDAGLRSCRERLDRLSVKEGVILRHLMAGRTVREIAAHHVVSEATVRTQVKAILGKLELSSQLAAVAVARDGGWCPEPTSLAG